MYVILKTDQKYIFFHPLPNLFEKLFTEFVCPVPLRSVVVNDRVT